MPTTQEIIEKMKRVIESSSIEQKPIVDRYITLGLKSVKVIDLHEHFELTDAFINEYEKKFSPDRFVRNNKPICIKL